jgi:hypothetical protein
MLFSINTSSPFHCYLHAQRGHAFTFHGFELLGFAILLGSTKLAPRHRLVIESSMPNQLSIEIERTSDAIGSRDFVDSNVLWS